MNCNPAPPLGYDQVMRITLQQLMGTVTFFCAACAYFGYQARTQETLRWWMWFFCRGIWLARWRRDCLSIAPR
jgi:hypothetical protein